MYPNGGRVPIRNSRNMNDNTNQRYSNHSSRGDQQNDNLFLTFDKEIAPQIISREFQKGAFKAKLDQRSQTSRNQDLRIFVEPPQAMQGSSQKPNRNTLNDIHIDPKFQQQQEIEYLKEEIENLKNQINSSVYRDMREIDKEIKFMKNEYSRNFESLTIQINKAMNKKEQSIRKLHDDSLSMRKVLNNISKDSQEKFESIMMEIAAIGSAGVKKSKNFGEYGIDLKSSIQGAGITASISGNNGSQNNLNTKIINELLLQIDFLKKEVQEGKKNVAIMAISIEEIGKLKPTASLTDNKTNSMAKLDQIQSLIKIRMAQNPKIIQIQDLVKNLQKRTTELDRVARIQQQNLKEMNREFTEVINQGISPRMKAVELAIKQAKQQKLNATEFQQSIKQVFKKEFKQEVNRMKVVQIRNPTQTEKEKLSLLTGANEDKISYKQTYFLDEESNLLDSRGVYLMEEDNGCKKKIKIEKDLVYLMQTNGVQIINCI